MTDCNHNTTAYMLLNELNSYKMHGRQKTQIWEHIQHVLHVCCVHGNGKQAAQKMDFMAGNYLL